MIEFACPSCSQALEVEDEATGLTVPCPTCNTSLTIPAKPAPELTDDIPTRVSPRLPHDEPQANVDAEAQPIPPKLYGTYSLNAERREKAAYQKKIVLLLWFFTSLTILFFGMAHGNGTASMLALISLVAVGVLLAPQIRNYLANTAREAEERRRRMQAEIDVLIQKHAEALRIKRLQKRRPDAYGNVVDDEWNREMEYFCQKVLRPAFPQMCNWSLLDSFPRAAKPPVNVRAPGVLDAVFLSDREFKRERKQADIANAAFYAESIRQTLFQRINAQIDKQSQSKPITALDVSTLSPTGYEAYCVQILTDDGWDATTTQTSGDQGVDILATRNGKKAVFQCKFYTSLVGNAAVQEAIAGKAWASADYAFVVSNADFTPPAKALAAKTGVHLIHHSNLSNLDHYLDPA
jgi:restriction system protein